MNRKIKQSKQDELNELVFPHANLHGDGEQFQIKMRAVAKTISRLGNGVHQGSILFNAKFLEAKTSRHYVMVLGGLLFFLPKYL